MCEFMKRLAGMEAEQLNRRGTYSLAMLRAAE